MKSTAPEGKKKSELSGSKFFSLYNIYNGRKRLQTISSLMNWTHKSWLIYPIYTIENVRNSITTTLIRVSQNETNLKSSIEGDLNAVNIIANLKDVQCELRNCIRIHLSKSTLTICPQREIFSTLKNNPKQNLQFANLHLLL